MIKVTMTYGVTGEPRKVRVFKSRARTHYRASLGAYASLRREMAGTPSWEATYAYEPAAPFPVTKSRHRTRADNVLISTI